MVDHEGFSLSFKKGIIPGSAYACFGPKATSSDYRGKFGGYQVDIRSESMSMVGGCRKAVARMWSLLWLNRTGTKK